MVAKDVFMGGLGAFADADGNMDYEMEDEALQIDESEMARDAQALDDVLGALDDVPQDSLVIAEEDDIAEGPDPELYEATMAFVDKEAKKAIGSVKAKAPSVKAADSQDPMLEQMMEGVKGSVAAMLESTNRRYEVQISSLEARLEKKEEELAEARAEAESLRQQQALIQAEESVAQNRLRAIKKVLALEPTRVSRCLSEIERVADR